MKLNQLRYFTAACKLNNITKAAQELHISQPSVSAAIKELEEEFGVTLMHRMNKGFVLTQEGKYLWDRAEQLLMQADALSQMMCDMGSMRNKINLGVPPMIGTFLFPDMYTGFMREYPQIRLNSLESGTKGLLEMLDRNELDFAIVPSNHLSPNDYCILELTRTETVFCVSVNHPLAGCESVSVPMIQDEPLIMFNDGFYQNEVIKMRYAAYGKTPNIIHYSGQFYTIKQFIAKGIMAGFMFRDIACTVPEIVGIGMDDPILIRISLIWKKNHHMFSDSAKFLKYANEFAKRND